MKSQALSRDGTGSNISTRPSGASREAHFLILLILIEFNIFIFVNYYRTTRMNFEILRLKGNLKSHPGT